MDRPLRIEYPGAFYHVTARGNEQRAIYKNIADRERFLDYLASATERYGAVIHVWHKIQATGCLTNRRRIIFEIELVLAFGKIKEKINGICE